ncbi:hypothetical protein OESDEN_18514 [Oesophagostomum dentatum]|uniref:Uncharacterized protein n=1 Tax=Oesophagostomum dentatum TaxID=61180 RepID=A0A0B1S929_OESDE|nr:hypothetical protein OESDEN_18514 [Oesophagostomum dentatum]
MALIVIKKSRLVGTLNGHSVYIIWYNRHFTEMLQSVLATPGFYFSYSIDLSRSLQWLCENGTPLFKETSMIDRVSVLVAASFTHQPYYEQKVLG